MSQSVHVGSVYVLYLECFKLCRFKIILIYVVNILHRYTLALRKKRDALGKRQTSPSVPPPGELNKTCASSSILVHSFH